MEKHFEIVTKYQKHSCIYFGKCRNEARKNFFYKKYKGNKEIYYLMLKNEFKILQSLNKLSVVPKIYDYYFGYEEGYIIIEYLDGVLLENYVFSDLKEKIFFMEQIINAVDLIHKCGIIHYDLKISNIFVLNSKKIKIIDFGISSERKINRFQGFISPLHCAPERMEKDAVIASEQIDVYSIGVVFYWILFGSFPFYGKSLNEIKQKKINNNYIVLSKNKILNNFFNKMLNSDLSIRYKNLAELKIDFTLIFKNSKCI